MIPAIPGIIYMYSRGMFRTEASSKYPEELCFNFERLICDFGGMFESCLDLQVRAVPANKAKTKEGFVSISQLDSLKEDNQFPWKNVHHQYIERVVVNDFITRLI